MYLTQFLVLIIFCGSSLSREEDSNELSPKPLSLDTNLRRALLKALTELENEEKEKVRSNSDRTVEKALASSFTILATNPTSEVPTEKPIVVLQKSNGLQHKPIIAFLPAFKNSNETEQFLTSATSRFSFPQEKRNTSPITNLSFRPEKFELTSPVPTVASPTTEENEAKVEDVQFLSAPLVAAFTVHQDEHGLPKSVEPIYKPSANVPVVTNIQEEQNLKRQQILRQEQFKQEHLRNQLALLEKQRILEDQLIRLQQQQKQQEEYLYKQQQILQEQLKIQSHKLQDEKLRLQQNEQSFRPIVSPPQFANTNQISNNLKSSNENAIVSFQSSISLNPVQKSELPLNAQHLPIKNPVNFLQSPYVQPVFNRINPVLTPPILAVQPTQKIFRREPFLGNFVNQDVSSNQVIFSNAPLVQLQPPLHASSVRLLRSNLESYHTSPGFPIQPPVINKQLNNLLYNSGITRGKQIEDLNIISKVLSYNHVGGDNFFGSFPPIKRNDAKA